MAMITMITALLYTGLLQSAVTSKTSQKSECNSLTFNYTISEPGCESRVIQNKFCYGQCRSYYLPNGKGLGSPSFTCSVCRPVLTTRKKYFLKCRTLGGVRYKTWTVSHIVRCGCTKTICMSWYAPGQHV